MAKTLKMACRGMKLGISWPWGLGVDRWERHRLGRSLRPPPGVWSFRDRMACILAGGQKENNNKNKRPSPCFTIRNYV